MSRMLQPSSCDLKGINKGNLCVVSSFSWWWVLALELFSSLLVLKQHLLLPFFLSSLLCWCLWSLDLVITLKGHSFSSSILLYPSQKQSILCERLFVFAFCPSLLICFSLKIMMESVWEKETEASLEGSLGSRHQVSLFHLILRQEKFTALPLYAVLGQHVVTSCYQRDRSVTH